MNAIDTLPAKTCRFLARAFLKPPLRRFGFRNDAISERFQTREKYVIDRVANVESYYALFSKHCDFTGKTVVDLGCNQGYILANLLKLTPFDAIGADINPDVLDRGRCQHGDAIRFVQTTATGIPLADNSVDIIYTIDTVEHLSRPREIFLEAYRILRPGGLFLVHFGPWLNPYGSHLEDIIPFPWPHAIFPMETLLSVAAELYDSPDYQPACYWFDAQTGQRRPNPYMDRARWDEFLNHMTIGRFKRFLKTLPFETRHFEKLGFGGRRFAAGSLLRRFVHVPIVDEFLTSNIFCVLRKA